MLDASKLIRTWLEQRSSRPKPSLCQCNSTIFMTVIYHFVKKSALCVWFACPTIIIVHPPQLDLFTFLMVTLIYCPAMTAMLDDVLNFAVDCGINGMRSGWPATAFKTARCKLNSRRYELCVCVSHCTAPAILAMEC